MIIMMNITDNSKSHRHISIEIINAEKTETT